MHRVHGIVHDHPLPGRVVLARCWHQRGLQLCRDLYANQPYSRWTQAPFYELHVGGTSAYGIVTIERLAIGAPL